MSLRAKKALKMKVQIKKIRDVKTPLYAHTEDAGFDLFAPEDVVVAPGERKIIPLGISLAIPEGYVGLMWEKSGLSCKHGLKSFGGVIDAGYRGEINACFLNTSSETYTIEKGHKVIQMLVQKIERVEFEEVEILSNTDRGEKGFGGSGK